MEQLAERIKDSWKVLMGIGIYVVFIIICGCLTIAWGAITKRISKVSFIQKRPCLISGLFVSVLSIIAAVAILENIGWFYYLLFRAFVCAVSLRLALIGRELGKVWLHNIGNSLWIFSIIVLFTVLAVIGRELDFPIIIWQVIDAVCAVVFAVIAFLVTKSLPQFPAWLKQQSDELSIQDALDKYISSFFSFGDCANELQKTYEILQKEVLLLEQLSADQGDWLSPEFNSYLHDKKFLLKIKEDFEGIKSMSY